MGSEWKCFTTRYETVGCLLAGGFLVPRRESGDILPLCEFEV